MTVKDSMGALTDYLRPVADLIGVSSVLSWDQETVMPPGGVQARAHQLGTLAAEVHRRYTDPVLGELLDSAETIAEENELLMIRAVRRQYERRSRLPEEFVVRRTELSSQAKEAWKRARAQNDFSTFAPYLARQFDLAREMSGYLADSGNPYDPLLDGFEPGLSYEWIRTRFDAAREPLKQLITAIAEARARDSRYDDADRAIAVTIPADRQLSFSRRMAETVGYDFNRGRLDVSAHPFTSGSSYQDVRLTTRVQENYFPACLFATIHEAGHGIHGQSTHPSLSRIPIRYGLAIAESQSRFYENLIGRSEAFWHAHFATMQESVPELSHISRDEWYMAINSVKPSFIRVEADEVTYGMHIMIRFELENALLNNEIATDDLPGEWNQKMQEYLGVTPPSDTEGVLQDIHWSQGGIGYFPDYLLGSMLSSRLWDAMISAHPAVTDEIAGGTVAAAGAWLESRVQTHGGLYTFPEIAERATGRAFTGDCYIAYLQAKYGRIYRL
jgi:carboxypeptidase Taq